MKKNKINKQQIQRFPTRTDKGLTNYQANLREAQGYSNATEIKVSRTYLDIFIKNFITFFNILLLIIGVILIAAGKWDSCFFLVILICNVSISLIQDIRAKRAIDKLNLATSTKVGVVREGRIKFLNQKNIVLDDVICLKTDDIVPCDSYILSGSASLNESLLTGESKAVRKNVGDMIFSGTYITNGEIRARVERVGTENYIQQLQSKSKDVKRQKSLIYRKLNDLFKVISFIVLCVGFLMLCEYGVFGDAFSSWTSFTENVALMAGSLVSMIPSGMYLLTSTSLTAGVLALTKKHVLVRDLYSVETLARADTICIDKTGTITDGTMSVSDVIMLDNNFNNDQFKSVIGSYLFATNDANFTAQALKDYFGTNNVFEPKKSIPFDSVNKYSAAQLDKIGTIVVGAYGFVPLKKQSDNSLERIINENSKAGFRTLVVGFSAKRIIGEKIPANLIPIAVIVIQDTIRANARETIKMFNENKVNIKVISGDNPLTVSKIAEKVGIINADKFISLEDVKIEDIPYLVDEYTVFGRVSPEQKEAIVKALKKKKHTTAMFGDGVNDILAMKSADVSISVSCGSKAAIDIANLVLTNNDFGSLPDIVAQGRRVINNLQRTCSLFLNKTVFSISLNLFFIIYSLILRGNGGEPLLRPFSTNNFYVWEFVSIGVSSFLLALEPNNEPLRGNFLLNIFKKAVPNGLIMSATIMLFFSVFTNMYSVADITEISVYFISIASIFVLLQVCIPFNKYRLSIYAGSVIATIVLFFLSVYSDMNILKLNRHLDSINSSYLLIYSLIIVFALMGVIYIISNYKVLFKKKNEINRKQNPE